MNYVCNRFCCTNDWETHQFYLETETSFCFQWRATTFG